MKKCLFFLYLLVVFYSCKNKTTTSTPLFSIIQKETNTSIWESNDTCTFKKFKENNTHFEIYYQKENNKTKEIDLHLYPTNDSTFIKLRNNYNSALKKMTSHPNFNSWETDSFEYILYKNSDSSILVNIYRKNNI